MKTIFTFIIILFFAVYGFAQETNSSGSKTTFDVTGNTTMSLLNIYPNPVKDFVNIDLQSSAAGSVQINLFNILGVQVKAWEPIYLSSGDQQIRLDLSAFKSGVYILKITKSGKVNSQVIKKS